MALNEFEKIIIPYSEEEAGEVISSEKWNENFESVQETLNNNSDIYNSNNTRLKDIYGGSEIGVNTIQTKYIPAGGGEEQIAVLDKADYNYSNIQGGLNALLKFILQQNYENEGITQEELDEELATRAYQSIANMTDDLDNEPGEDEYPSALAVYNKVENLDATIEQKVTAATALKQDLITSTAKLSSIKLINNISVAGFSYGTSDPSGVPDAGEGSVYFKIV